MSGDTESNRRDEIEQTRLTSSTKRVIPGEFPHASKKLGKTTTEDSHPNYNIWVGDVTRLKVVQGQNESGGSKREQATVHIVQLGEKRPCSKRYTYRGAGLATLEGAN